MPVPSPCIRFRDVYIYRIFGESMLQYLRNAKQSFIGSIIFYGMRELENTDMKRQMFYLLENVFHKPSYVFMYGYSTHFLNCVKRTEDLPNCTNVKLTLFEHFHVQSNFNEDSVRILVDWLQSSKNVTSGSGQTLTQKKHLTLIHFPRSVILNMVQQIRDDFESSTLAPSDFVVTFIGSWESPYYLSYKSITLEGDQEFVLDKVSGNGRLSFFRHCPLFGEVDNLAYRLWSRTVISEAEDSFVSTILQNSKKMYTNELYRDFYRVDYPHGDLRAWY
ncbi:hypothetical protein Ddc_15706 [Ditylenchus destructor]|nr:hypothetical protein Ddc_15706 [Ditylenchus destructor]